LSLRIAQAVLSRALRRKASGIGHYYGKHGFDTLTHAKSMLISPPDSAIAHMLPPYTDAKNEELKQWLDY
jgi:aldehyde dehydrogenase (NAD+)